MDKNFLLSIGIDEKQADAVLESIRCEFDEFRPTLEREGLSDKYSRAVNGALTLAGAKNVTAARSVLDFDWDGNDFEAEPSGLSDAVSSLKASMPYLFSQDTDCVGGYSFAGISPVEEADGDIAPEELSYSEYMRLYRGR